jgi:alpha-tubulin suppressor-like RCC1 family protein
MPNFYNFKENGVVYSFDDIFIPADLFRNGNLLGWGDNGNSQLGTNDFSNRSTPVTTSAGGTNWKQVSAGRLHTTAIKTDGTLWVWGRNTSGQLGINNTSQRLTPVTTFAGGTDWKQVSAGYHTTAIKTDGTLWSWGENNYGQLGINDTTNRSTPVTTFAGGTDWKQVSGNFRHTAAIKTDGTLWTWGYGNQGQLGKGNYVPPNFGVLTPVTTFAGGNNWADTATGEPEELYTLSAGYNHTTAIKTDGTLWTWGRNYRGELGTNNTITRSTPVTTFAGGTNWKQVSAGSIHTAAIKTDGTLWTWGYNSYGNLGTNNTITRSTPVTTFAGGTDWKQVSAGNRYTSAIKTDGTLWVWGRNTSGQLGTSDTIHRSTPVTTFAGGTNWKQVSSGVFHTTAIKTDGTLWTWGRGNEGQLGKFYEQLDILTPVTTFAGGTNWADTATGEPEELYTLSAAIGHTGAIKTDGTLWIWGLGTSGQLGTNDTITRSTPVTTFAGGTNWKQISVGNSYTAAIKTDGTLWVWGSTGNGQLGTNNFNSNAPVTTFAGGTNWKQVSCSTGYWPHTAAIKTDGTLWLWGENNNGRLGNNDQSTSSGVGDINIQTPITTFAGGTNWKQVSVSNAFSAAVKTDGTLWVWGAGTNGRLGTNDTSEKRTPVTTFAGGTNWKQVSAGSFHTTAIKTDGTLWTWGFNYNGYLGTNDTTNRSTPVTTFAGGTNWKQVSSGGRHTTAIKTDGTLWSWGRNNTGQLGINNKISRFTPVTTFAGGTNWKQVSAGDSYTIALRDDGVNKQLYLWGVNTTLQLADNSYPLNYVPNQTHQETNDWKQVSSGYRNTAAIKTDGTLWIWGSGGNGELGTNDFTARSTPVTTFAGGTNWKQVSSARFHTAAVKTDGTLWTWGYTGRGQLGINNTTTRFTPVTTFAGGTDWKQVSAGRLHTTALRDDGVNKELYVWGSNQFNEIGINLQLLPSLIPNQTYQETNDWKQVSTGNFNTAAIKTDGTLWTWGSGGSGYLGTNDFTARSTPVTTFAGGTNWKQVSSRGRHTAAIKTNGTLWTWGRASEGQLGRITSFSQILSSVITPVTTFAGGNNWADTANGEPEELYTLSAGYNQTAAIKTDGTLWTWGVNWSGYLGINDETGNPRYTPVTTFAGGTDWKQVTIGYYSVTAAIKTDGTLWLWGYNNNGYLGNNSDNLYVYTPITTFAGGTNWKQVSAGQYPVAAIKTDGTLWTWGRGSGGPLGTNDEDNRSTPVTTFAGGTDWKQISCGDYHVAAIKTDGTLWLWGWNFNGYLGTNDTTNRSTPVTTFSGGTDWKQVSGGASYTTAIKTDGTLWTWGYNNNNQLGINNTDDIYTPVTTFAGGTNWKQVSAGKGYPAQTAAVKTDGTLWTWGYNNNGQLGTNDTITRSTPVTTFAGGTNWKQVFCGYKHTVALQDDGVNKQLFTFGSDSYGALGLGLDSNIEIITNRIPAQNYGKGMWKQVNSAGYYTTAIKTDGTLWTWGSNYRGQLGTNDYNNRPTPVTTFAGGTNWKQSDGGRFHTVAIRYDEPSI